MCGVDLTQQLCPLRLSMAPRLTQIMLVVRVHGNLDYIRQYGCWVARGYVVFL